MAQVSHYDVPMSSSGPPPPPPPPRRNSGGPSGARGPRISEGWPRWSVWVLIAGLVAVLAITTLGSPQSAPKVSYSGFMSSARAGKVKSIRFDNNNGKIEGTYKDGKKFSTTGLLTFPDADLATLEKAKVEVTPSTPQPGWFAAILPFILMFGIFGLFIFWMQRRAQGQMSGVMSIGRSKAKTYSTDSPRTTFADVAGYEGVKTEIREVVDFLKYPERFAQIGARIPKGVLLVGPPGTGKTLIARAVAGEAGVPFLSVTGSDFMEMFVGVGASRVRDLFQTARKMGRAIIFIDEIDSIGRKRGAGLGGGHDEREQTLNQMLSEMDGFEATEGIVMLAATNRPDILDSALLRPGRFDRQVVVPLPELSEREAVLEVHAKGKNVDESVDLSIVARGTPGMSGADLSNLVNEAALHAVRQGRETVTMLDFDYARDRMLMGQRRESLAMSPREKELTAYHEGGHALCAAVLPHADPVHKVTILPMGMALGVTMQLPEQDRHSLEREWIESRIVVAMGGRVAEQLVFQVSSTGASNDLVTSTELAHRMVSEFGMSDRIGPMAWGTNNEVFLGDGLAQTRQFSDETARVIDEEVGRILREAEARCIEILTEHRPALDLIAKALLEKETLDGAEVNRLVDVGGSGGDGGGGSPTPSPESDDGGSPTSVVSPSESAEDGASEDDERPLQTIGDVPTGPVGTPEPVHADDERPPVWASQTTPPNAPPAG